MGSFCHFPKHRQTDDPQKRERERERERRERERERRERERERIHTVHTEIMLR